MGLFRAMDGLPVTIRLLDPPLHEFLPKREEPDGRDRSLEAQPQTEEDVGRGICDYRAKG